MGIVFRQSIKSTIVIFTGNLIGAAVNYYSTYVFEDDIQQFGFSRTIITVGAIAIFVLLLGASVVLQIFMQRYSGNPEKKKVLITITSLVPVLAALFFFPFYLAFKEPIIHLFKPEDQPYFAIYFLWLPVLFVMWSYMVLYESYLVSQHKTAQALLIREVVLRVCNLATLGALYFQMITFHGFVLLTILSYCLSAVVLLALSARTYGFGFSFRWKLFSRKEYKEMINFSWYHLLMGVSFQLVGFLDILMLAILDKDGVASVPAYSISVFIATLMTVPYRAMTSATFPVLNQAYIDQDKERLSDIFRRSGINILIMAVAMALVIGLNLNNAVAILPQGYEAILWLAPILMLGRMADMATGLNNEIISISSLYKFNFRISIVLLTLIVLLNRILIPEYGAFGAAWAITAALIVFNLAKLFFLYKKMGLHPFTMKSLRVIVAGIVTAMAVYFIPVMWNPVADAIIRTAIITLIYASLLLWLKPSEDINTYLATVRKDKRLF